MADKKLNLEVPLDMTEEEFESLTGKYITIPPGADGVEREGDNIYVLVEAGMPEWKQPGVSFLIPLTVTEEGINKGKTTEWYLATSKGAQGINKAAAKVFGVLDAAFPTKNGKKMLNPTAFTGASAMAKIVRERSNKGNLRSVLDSTSFLPVGSKTSKSASDIV